MVTVPRGSALRHRRTSLVEHVQRSTSAADVFAVASARLRRLVPFDAAAWLATDPGTGLPTAPSRIDDLDGVTQAMCSAHWHHELLTDDVNLFRDLARAETPSAALRRTVGDPGRSGRFRRFLRPLGFHDELRTVLRIGDAAWGTVTLWRRAGTDAFSSSEESMLASLSAPLGEALRRHARPAAAPAVRPPPIDQPGLLVFDAGGDVVSVNDEAQAWLAELPPEPGVATAYGVLPVWMLITVYRAAALRHGAGDGTARTRVRTRQGRWLVCHASCLRRSDGDIGTIALVIEPAQPATIAPIVVEAYDLTDREQQVVRLIARGATTAEIAENLLLSRHTVRDHVKAIFAKTGVSSRGELTAKLFAEFYEPVHSSDVARTAHA